MKYEILKGLVTKYKYRVCEDYWYNTGIKGYSYANSHLCLSVGGQLLIMKGYRWDGASGAIDTDSFMRASLVHDALYQLIREGALFGKHRKRADEILYDIAREDGMSWYRAQWVYWAVRAAGGKAARPTEFSALVRDVEPTDTPFRSSNRKSS